jgi:hypothetical protein
VRKNVPFAGTARQLPRQANPRPSAGLQNDFSSDERESACKPGVFIEAAHDRRTASPESVRRTQTNKATAATKKTCKCRPFAKRLKGFEPSTFCMASSLWDWVETLNIPANAAFLPRDGGAARASDFTLAVWIGTVTSGVGGRVRPAAS